MSYADYAIANKVTGRKRKLYPCDTYKKLMILDIIIGLLLLFTVILPMFLFVDAYIQYAIYSDYEYAKNLYLKDKGLKLNQ